MHKVINFRKGQMLKEERTDDGIVMTVGRKNFPPDDLA